MGCEPAGTEPTPEELAELADGSLEPGRRAEVEAWLGTSPKLAAEAEEQRRAAIALRGVRVRAPARLRAGIDGARRLGEQRRRRRRGRTALAGLATAAAAIVAVAVLAGGSEPASPSVSAVADLGGSPPTEAPPRPGADRRLLDRSAEGLGFPNLEQRFGWTAVGARTEQLDGRQATTVTYQRRGRRIAYTILSGPPLAPPAGAERVLRAGIELRRFAASGERAAVTWRRGGRTCVLSGEGVRARTLVRLAVWPAGAMRFSAAGRDARVPLGS